MQLKWTENILSNRKCDGVWGGGVVRGNWKTVVIIYYVSHEFPSSLINKSPLHSCNVSFPQISWGFDRTECDEIFQFTLLNKVSAFRRRIVLFVSLVTWIAHPKTLLNNYIIRNSSTFGRVLLFIIMGITRSKTCSRN